MVCPLALTETNVERNYRNDETLKRIIQKNLVFLNVYYVHTYMLYLDNLLTYSFLTLYLPEI
jgi:hypothetical protein